MATKKAIFLDRDGIINVDKSYVYRFEDIEWMPGIVDLIKFFNAQNYLVIVLTNQSGVDRGYYKEEDIEKLHLQMTLALKNLGAEINGWYYCLKLDSEDRKPNPGMMIKAQKDFDIDLSNSLMLGDKESDILNLSGPKYYLLKGNYPFKENIKPEKIFSDLIEAKNYFEKSLIS